MEIAEEGPLPEAPCSQGVVEGRSVVVPEGVCDLPLAKFLHTTWSDAIRSMSAARRLCRGLQRQVLVNGEPGACSMRVSTGDVVEWPRPQLPRTTSPHRPDLASGTTKSTEGAWDESVHIPGVDVLYEDGELVALSKPAGVLAHPLQAAKTHEATMHDLGLARGALGAVHRLDRKTSGILLFGKSAEAIRSLQAAWSDHSCTSKEYLALVGGTPSQPQWTVDEPLRKLRTASDLARRRRTQQRLMNEESDRIVFRDDDHLQPVLACGFAALVCCRLELGGRTHQIRRHLQACGHPVVGDNRYGSAEVNSHMRQRLGVQVDDDGAQVGLATTPGSGASSRLFLHAWRLRVRHPSTAASLRLEAPPPADLTAALLRLGAGPGTLAVLGGAAVGWR